MRTQAVMPYLLVSCRNSPVPFLSSTLGTILYSTDNRGSN